MVLLVNRSPSGVSFSTIRSPFFGITYWVHVTIGQLLAQLMLHRALASLGIQERVPLDLHSREGRHQSLCLTLGLSHRSGEGFGAICVPRWQSAADHD